MIFGRANCIQLQLAGGQSELFDASEPSRSEISGQSAVRIGQNIELCSFANESSDHSDVGSLHVAISVWSLGIMARQRLSPNPLAWHKVQGSCSPVSSSTSFWDSSPVPLFRANHFPIVLFPRAANAARAKAFFPASRHHFQPSKILEPLQSYNSHRFSTFQQEQPNSEHVVHPQSSDQ